MADEADTILVIPITKAKSTISINPNDLPQEMLVAALAEGLKVLLNAKMSKVSVKDLTGDQLADAQSAAMVIANKNLSDIMESKIKRRGAASATDAKLGREVTTEAMRMSRGEVKDTLRAAGIVPSRVEPAKITEAAKRLLAEKPEIIEAAKANIAARTASKPTIAKDAAAEFVASLGITGESPKLVAKAAKAKEDRKSSLSKTQAGIVAPRRSRGDVTPTHVH